VYEEGMLWYISSFGGSGTLTTTRYDLQYNGNISVKTGNRIYPDAAPVYPNPVKNITNILEITNRSAAWALPTFHYNTADLTTAQIVEKTLYIGVYDSVSGWTYPLSVVNATSHTVSTNISTFSWLTLFGSPYLIEIKNLTNGSTYPSGNITVLGYITFYPTYNAQTTANYYWLTNGIVGRSGTWIGTLNLYNYSCYQETANVSTVCGGLATGIYATTKDAFYINYTKPVNSTSNSQWQIKRGALPAMNLTIPSDCWDYNATTLMLKMASAIVPNGNSTPYCYNGTWEAIGSTIAGNDWLGSTGNLNYTWYDENWSTFTAAHGSIDYWVSEFGGGTTNISNASLYEEGMWWMGDALPTNMDNYTFIGYPYEITNFSVSTILPDVWPNVTASINISNDRDNLSFGTNVSRIRFLASSASSLNTVPVNQTDSNPIIVTNMTTAANASIVLKLINVITGVTFKCSPANNSTNAIPLSGSYTVVANTSGTGPYGIWCWADFNFPHPSVQTFTIRGFIINR
jgi:hypothetical protein